MNYEWNSREETAAIGFWPLAVGEYREQPLLVPNALGTSFWMNSRGGVMSYEF